MASSRGRRTKVRGRAATIALIAVVAGALLCAPSSAGTTGASGTPQLTLSWLVPTPSDGATFTVTVGEPFAASLAAGGGAAAAKIWASGLAAGAALRAAAGRPATAEVTWTPRSSQIGTHVFVFAGGAVTGAAATPPRTIFVHVVPAGAPGPREVTPIGTTGVYRWAYVLRPTAARTRASTAARVITRLTTYTSDDEVNLVLLLARTTDANGRLWYRVRLPILPNGSTGWVRADALTTTRPVTTYLVVFRKLFTATLYRRGRPIFRTRVGVGKPYWPTPPGDYYIREVLTGYDDPFYGPVAFGTNARSAVLTDWPGGGFVGIHGTSLPWLLPGRVSHGCVRMKNGPIMRLKRLMPVGTPLAIR